LKVSEQPKSDDGTVVGDITPTERFQLWAKYEDVAMHFNDLIMKWRLQAIGGLAALVTLAGSVIGQVENHHQRYWGMILLATTFCFVWLGLAVLDLFYYRKLLRGAVDDLLVLESQIHIKMSTRIEHFARCGGEIGPWVFYLFGTIPLIFILGYAIVQLNSPPGEPSSPSTCCCSSGAER